MQQVESKRIDTWNEKIDDIIIIMIIIDCVSKIRYDRLIDISHMTYII